MFIVQNGGIMSGIKLFIYFMCMVGGFMAQAAQQCMVIGHRGACGYAPENSLESFKKAIELGVDMIEFDVHKCASGELVVIHDDTLQRTVNAHGYVKDMTLDQLRSLTLKNSNESVPTLEEVLDVINHKARVAIELKGLDTAIPTAAVVQQCINKGWQPSDFLVLSFDHLQLQEFHTLMPQIERCATVYGMIFSFAQYAQKHGFCAVAVCYTFITPEFMQDAHAHGLKVLVYTVNDPVVMHKMLTLGVGGMFCDYPDRLQALLM